MIYFISGHLDLTQQEFDEHYAPRIREVIGTSLFIIGDARGADAMAQEFVLKNGGRAIVFHMFDSPRNNAGFPTRGGFETDKERDAAMTKSSDADLAWVRPGREKSGTAKNLKRRLPCATS